MPEQNPEPMVAPEDASPELRRLHASVSSLMLAVTAYLNNTTALEISQHYGDISGELMENFAQMGETGEERVARLVDSAQRSFTMLIHSSVTVAEFYRRYLEAEEGGAGMPSELEEFLAEGMRHTGPLASEFPDEGDAMLREALEKSLAGSGAVSLEDLMGVVHDMNDRANAEIEDEND